jgi:hypothetical protein
MENSTGVLHCTTWNLFPYSNFMKSPTIWHVERLPSLLFLMMAVLVMVKWRESWNLQLPHSVYVTALCAFIGLETPIKAGLSTPVAKAIQKFGLSLNSNN